VENEHINVERKNTEKIIICLLSIVLVFLILVLSIIIFIRMVVPRSKGMTPVLIFLVISLIGVYGFGFFKFRRKSSPILGIFKQILLVTFIILTLFFLFLICLRLTFEKQGTNEVPLFLTIQPYLASDTLDLYNKTVLYEANDIYKKYNLSIHINNPINLNFSFNDSDKRFIRMQNCTFIDALYDLVNDIEREVKLVIVNDFSNVISDGMASICNKSDLIIMSANTPISSGWILAHELGHVLSVEKEYLKYNLMKEGSDNIVNWLVHDYLRNQKPSYLRQEQIDTIVRSVQTRFSLSGREFGLIIDRNRS
jgi:hypothetical protein